MLCAPAQGPAPHLDPGSAQWLVATDGCQLETLPGTAEPFTAGEQTVGGGGCCAQVPIRQRPEDAPLSQHHSGFFSEIDLDS